MLVDLLKTEDLWNITFRLSKKREVKVSHFFVSNFQKGEKEKERKLFFFSIFIAFSEKLRNLTIFDTAQTHILCHTTLPVVGRSR